jgi:hypothetical protein
MNLIVFDCDDTIWELPYDEEDSYMKLPESLDYDFKYKKDVIQIYFEKRKNPNNIFVLLSNRTNMVKDDIISKLKEDKNIVFDYVLFRNKDRDKSNRLKTLLENLDIELVEFYDDKQKHRKSIRKLKNKFSDVEIKTYKV